MLKDILENRQGFKLVCGAGNEDADEVERLVTIYAGAGCKFFDVCAKPEIVDAAKRGIQRSGADDCSICVSVGIAGDPHITKAVINQDICVKCGKCKIICPHDAIIELDKYKVKKIRCIGCSLCAKNCPKTAITMTTETQDYETIFPDLISKGIECIEFHAISENEYDVNEKWQQITNCFDGLICISIDRSILGDKKLLERVEKLVKTRPPYTTIIQADGVAMSGNNDEYSTTLQAVATAQLFQKAELPSYLMISGGTNTKTTELAKLCGVKPHCIAVGSYARKIVKDYLLSDDLYENTDKMSKAVNIAKNLIDISLENMHD